jgi:archaeal flagellin FlaB
MKKMRNIKKILKEDDLGDMGIGAMIVFIAMVLVAGIAASVLIQTANKLEIQAMVTGQETTREVSTGLAVVDIEGQVNSSGIVSDMTITVRARAGSGDIDLSQTVIEVTDGTTKTLLTYTPAANKFSLISAGTGEIFDAALWTAGGSNLTNEQFGILVLQDEDNSLTQTNPVINRGDLVMLCISTGSCFNGLDPRDDIWGLVSPEQGAPGIFAFRVPSSLTEEVYDLY